MAFHKIKELSPKQALIMLGFMSSGILPSALLMAPWLAAFFGASGFLLFGIALLNTCAMGAGVFFLPALYLQLLKVKKQWPFVADQKNHWRPSLLLADITLALDCFNEFLPIRKFCVILGFLATLAAPWYLALLGPLPTTYAIVRSMNFAICLSSFFMLPLLYFQALKAWQVWPLHKPTQPAAMPFFSLQSEADAQNNVKSSFRLSPTVWIKDGLFALRKFDWKLLNLTSDIVFAIAFPRYNQFVESLKFKNDFSQNVGLKAKVKWLGGTMGLLIANFWMTFFHQPALDRFADKTPKRFASYLFSVGIRESIHSAAYFLKNKKRLEKDPGKEGTAILKDLGWYNADRILHADLPAQGLFQTIYTAAEEEALVQAAAQFAFEEFSNWKELTKQQVHGYFHRKFTPLRDAANRVKGCFQRRPQRATAVPPEIPVAPQSSQLSCTRS